MVDGDAKEREAVNVIDAAEGWAVMRAPASGGGTDRDLPDILAGNGRTFLIIELKSSGGDPIYIDQEEVEALRRFAQNFGGVAMIACRWSSRSLRDDSFYLQRPENLYRTDAGTYRAKYEDMGNWITLDSILNG